MDIFFMFIFNIFTGAVIFLILSLKIEKTSATFQEKKLRREMGEIITEFNSTAERNISLLESRIEVMKKLMNENGSLKGIDFTVMDESLTNNRGSAESKGSVDENKRPFITEKKVRKTGLSEAATADTGKGRKLIDSFIDKFQSINSDDDNASGQVPDIKISTEVKNVKDKVHGNSVIERNISDFPSRKSSSLNLIADEEIVLTYNGEDDSINSVEEPENIEDLFRNADDKYKLIARLFSEGHSVEDLSRYSGIPSGEIKLVISLNS